MSDLPISDQAKLKIGEAIIRYQRFEYLLKKLIPLSQLKMRVGDTREQVELQFSAMDKQTMGGLVSSLFDRIYSVQGMGQEPEHPPESIITFHLRSELSSAKELEEKKSQCTEILNYRNNLIHTRLLSFNSSDDKACRELIDELDEQLKKLKPLDEELRNLFMHAADIMAVYRDAPGLLNGQIPDSLQLGDHHFIKDSQTSSR